MAAANTKRKIGTTLDAGLYRRVQEAARRRGQSTNAVIEEALTRFLATDRSPASAVEETKGTYRIGRKVLGAILNESLYGAR